MRTVSELKAIAAAYDKTTSDAHMFASTPVLDICKQQFKYRQEGREITEQ